jgi:L-asparaginase
MTSASASDDGTPLGVLARPVRVIGVGGTIAMHGSPAKPALEPDALIAAIPQLREVEGLSVETFSTIPGAHLQLADIHRLALRARAATADGEGVVITTGTDTLEELAILVDLTHSGSVPIVVTGANRTASAPGADGPANLLDAIAVAGARGVDGIGVVVVFGGEIHAAARVRKVDSTGPSAFGSPLTGPIGRVVEQRAWLGAVPLRPPALEVQRLGGLVPIVVAALGQDGSPIDQAVSNGADGIVVSALGAGHLPPAMLSAIRTAAQQIPVVTVCRPERSTMLVSTYGFEGAEIDLRASGAITAPLLSAPAARIKLLAGLGAGFDTEQLRTMFAFDDVVPINRMSAR